MRILFVINSPEAKFPRDLALETNRRKDIDLRLFNLLDTGKKSKDFLFRLRFILSLPSLLFHLRREIRTFQPDVVHSNFWLSDVVVRLATYGMGGLRLISTQHDEAELPFFIRLVKRWALKRFDKVCAISKSVASFLTDYLAVPEEKVVLVYNGIEIDDFAGAQKSRGAWGPVLGTFARLERIKGVDLLILALAGLENPPETYIVGDGAEKRELILKSKKIERLAKQIHFVGHQKDIVAYLKKVDVVVVPSRSEGLGNIILEAMAAKKLVLAAKTGGISELVEDGKTGLLFERNDISSVEKTIEWVVSNKDKSLEIAEAGGAWLDKNRELFDLDKTIEKYLKIYAE